MKAAIIERRDFCLAGGSTGRAVPVDIAAAKCLNTVRGPDLIRTIRGAGYSIGP